MKVSAFVAKYSVVDWVMALGLWGASLALHLHAAPHHSFVVIDSEGMPLGLTFPKKEETVNETEVAVLALAFPICAILLSYVVKRKRENALAEGVASLAGLVLATGTNMAVTLTLKLTMGVPRPNFAELCGWDPQRQECTASPRRIREAFSSFPSGHASLSFAGLVYLSLAMANAWRVPRTKRREEEPSVSSADGSPDPLHQRLTTDLERAEDSPPGPEDFREPPPDPLLALRSALLLSPIWLACFISVTRVVNYYHFTQDVVGGAVTGTGFALWAGWLKLPLFRTSASPQGYRAGQQA